MTTIYVKNTTLEIYSEEKIRGELYDTKSVVLPQNLTQEILKDFKFTIVSVPDKPKLNQYQTATLSPPKHKSKKIIVEWLISNSDIDDNLKQSYIEKLRTVFEKQLQTIKATYPESEVDGWDLQKDEAKNYLLDSNYSTPCLDALAFHRGINKTLLAQKIIEKANQFAHVYGTIIGTRQKIEDQILAAKSYSELPVILDNYIF